MNTKVRTGEEEKQKTLKKIIRDLHAGIPVKKLQKTFARLIRNTSPEEIASMENALIHEGFPPSEIQRLCDVHVQVFEKSLAKVGKPGKIPGHPIHSFVQENREAKKILKSLAKILKRMKRGEPKEKDIFQEKFRSLKEINKHFVRKENQLFPALEAKHFTGPTQVMWGKHDEIRDLLKKTESAFIDADWGHLSKYIKILASSINKLIFLEEKILYPTSEKKLTQEDWVKIKKGESEIGYAWIAPSHLWDANIAKSKFSESLTITSERTETMKETHEIQLSQGRLTEEQLNLMLKNLPVDLTFVDENDTVRFYSDTKDRIFPRSPAVIGRAVQNCHPPKSVHVVENILKSFKEKKKDVAEFWIQMKGRFIHIRYFPVYDENGNYKGVIEVTQEVSGIRALEGEKRILDWK